MLSAIPPKQQKKHIITESKTDNALFNSNLFIKTPRK